jgi:hypothetical protein
MRDARNWVFFDPFLQLIESLWVAICLWCWGSDLCLIATLLFWTQDDRNTRPTWLNTTTNTFSSSTPLNQEVNGSCVVDSCGRWFRPKAQSNLGVNSTPWCWVGLHRQLVNYSSFVPAVELNLLSDSSGADRRGAGWGHIANRYWYCCLHPYLGTMQQAEMHRLLLCFCVLRWGILSALDAVII